MRVHQQAMTQDVEDKKEEEKKRKEKKKRTYLRAL